MYHKILQTFAELFFPEESWDALHVRKEEVYLLELVLHCSKISSVGTHDLLLCTQVLYNSWGWTNKYLGS